MPIEIKNDPELTQQKLHSLLDYDEETGLFLWRKRDWPAHQWSGRKAGSSDAAGYMNIKLLGRTYKSHRLAWLYVHGSWPDCEIDHINGDRGDNRIRNLRDVDRAENLQGLRLYANNATGMRGVFHCKTRNRYRARVTKNGKQRYYGSYRTAEEASARYLAEISGSD